MTRRGITAHGENISAKRPATAVAGMKMAEFLVPATAVAGRFCVMSLIRRSINHFISTTLEPTRDNGPIDPL
ncbi:MAG: hypothetical protein K8R46_06055, partial [Pirellulales bacterium]|nr:hypothetical protein [Pirellulales bacterium]